MTSMTDVATLAIRGRGIREFAADELLLVSEGGYEIPRRIPAREVRAGDFVGIAYGWDWPSEPAVLPSLSWGRVQGSEKQIRVPDRMTTELAFLLGAYLSEGHTTRSNWSVILTNSVMQVLVRAQRAWLSEFALDARVTRQPERCTGLVVSSKRLVELMDFLDCGSRAANKRVPDVIMNSTREHVLAFLQGASLDAYTTTTTAAKWAICLESAQAIQGIQELVTRLGITNAQITKFNKVYQKTYFELYVPGRSGQELCELVPFLEPDKQARAELYIQSNIGGIDSTDVIPGIHGRELFDLIPAGRCGRNGRGTGRQAFRHLCDPRTRHVTRRSVLQAIAAGAEIPRWIEDVVAAQVRFAPVMVKKGEKSLEEWWGLRGWRRGVTT